MRSMLFRYWNEKKKKFIFFDIYDQKKIPKKYERNVQRYTGLTDCNKNLIYEGDLIKGNNFGPYLVFFDKGCFCSCCYSDSETIRSYNTIKIVGHCFDGSKYYGQQWS